MCPFSLPNWKLFQNPSTSIVASTLFLCEHSEIRFISQSGPMVSHFLSQPLLNPAVMLKEVVAPINYSKDDTRNYIFGAFPTLSVTLLV
jgi:hypothetical protein